MYKYTYWRDCFYVYCLKRTRGTHYPNSPQTRSLSKVSGVCQWNTYFPRIFEANFKMLSHTGYQKHWVWASWNLSVQNSFWAYSALLKHHTVTQISQKKLKCIPKFQSILQAYWTECYKYCIIIVESNTEKTKNSLFIEQNVVITFCLSICLLHFVLALLYSMAEFFHFLDPVLPGYT